MDTVPCVVWTVISGSGSPIDKLRCSLFIFNVFNPPILLYEIVYVGRLSIVTLVQNARIELNNMQLRINSDWFYQIFININKRCVLFLFKGINNLSIFLL